MHDVDVIAACPLPTLNVWYAWEAARRYKLPFIIIPCFHTEDKSTFHNQLFFKMMREADAVICLTESERKYLQKEGKIEAKRLHTIGVGINIDQAVSPHDIRKKYNISQKEIVLFLGQHGLHKGILHLIKSMDYVWREREDVGLVIAGNPTAHTLEIEKKISKLEPSYQKRIYLCKSISEEEKIAFLQAAEIFVSVSLFESFGIVFLEAWREKLPVIGCKKGGSSRLIDEFNDGLLVEFANSPQLGGAILELLANEEIRKEMGERGYAKIVEKYAWDKIMDKWENLYHEIVRRK
jgi:glycosyltransferase involved in cell wall biosynthesis